MNQTNNQKNDDERTYSELIHTFIERMKENFQFQTTNEIKKKIYR